MSKIILQEEASTPETPGSGKWSFYAKADGGYLLDDAGNEIRLYTGSTAADHEALTGLLGGSANNHFHLTPAQVTGLVSGTYSTLHFHSGTVIQDEGIFKGNVSTFNFVGSTIDASVSGTVARIFVTGSVGGSSAPYNSSDFTGTLWVDLTDNGFTNIHNHTGTYTPYIIPSTSGNVLTSDGTNWTSRVQDGWIPVADTWTYASATTINVPSGAASIYSPGDKIKLTQTTVKRFYIITVADTLLTVVGASTETVANAAITLPYYSHAKNPLGWVQTFKIGLGTATNSGTDATSTSATLAEISSAYRTSNLTVVKGNCVQIIWKVSGLYITSVSDADMGINIGMDGVATFASQYSFPTPSVNPWCAIDGTRNYESTHVFFITGITPGDHYFTPCWKRLFGAGTMTIKGWATQYLTAFEIF